MMTQIPPNLPNMGILDAQTVAALTQQLEKLKQILPQSGAVTPPDPTPTIQTGANRRTEQITGFVVGNKNNGEMRVDLYGHAGLKHKVVSLWAEQVPEIAGMLIEHIGRAKKLPMAGNMMRADAEKNGYFYPVPFPLYCVIETREVDDGKGQKIKRSSAISLHSSAETPAQQPVHHRPMGNLNTARQRHSEAGDTLATALYPELCDLFQSPNSIEEVIVSITGEHISLEAMPAIAATLHYLAWFRYTYDGDIDSDTLLMRGREFWATVKPTPVAGYFFNAPNSPAVAKAAQNAPEDTLNLAQPSPPAVRATPNASLPASSPPALTEKEVAIAINAIEAAGKMRFGAGWDSAQKERSLAWAHHGFPSTRDGEAWKVDIGRIQVSDLGLEQLQKLAQKLTPATLFT